MRYDNDNLIRVPPPSRILICGFGSIGRRHFDIIRSNWPHVEVGILSHHALSTFNNNSDTCQVFSSLEQSIAWMPTAAIISSPASLHLKQAIALSEARIPFLLEKPVGTGLESPADWMKFVRLSKNLPILVGYVLRHDPCFSYIDKGLKEGRFGDVVECDFYCGSWLPEWRPDRDYRQCVSAKLSEGGGALLELSHELDLALYLLGPIGVHSAILSNSGLLDIDVEDQVQILATSANQIISTIRLNFCTNPPKRNVTLRSTKGEVFWNLIENSVSFVDNNSVLIDTYCSSVSASDRYYFQLLHFFECVSGDQFPACSLHDGLQVLEFVKEVRAKSSKASRSYA